MASDVSKIKVNWLYKPVLQYRRWRKVKGRLKTSNQGFQTACEVSGTAAAKAAAQPDCISGRLVRRDFINIRPAMAQPKADLCVFRRPLPPRQGAQRCTWSGFSGECADSDTCTVNTACIALGRHTLPRHPHLLTGVGTCFFLHCFTNNRFSDGLFSRCGQLRQTQTRFEAV